MKNEKFYVKVDSRNRITIPKALTENLPSLFKIYKEGNAIILEPVYEVEKEDRWLLEPQNKDAIEKLKKTLDNATDKNSNSKDKNNLTISDDPKKQKSFEKVMKKYEPALKKLSKN